MRIERIASRIPSGRASTRAIIADAGGDPLETRYFEKLFQMHSVAVAHPEKGPNDYLADVLTDFGDVDPVDLPDTLIYAHAQPVAAGKALQERAQLSSHPWLARLKHVYELDQYNCATAFFGLKLACSLLESGHSHRVLLFAGDSFADWPLRYRYLPAVTLLGDAFCGLLLSKRPGGLQVRHVETSHDRRFCGGIDADEQELQAFNLAHADLVSAAMSRVGHQSNPEREFLPHNINGLAWKVFAHENAALRPPRTELVPEIGHCCTTDPFLLLHRLMQEAPRIDATLLSIGMGAYVGVAHVQHS